MRVWLDSNYSPKDKNCFHASNLESTYNLLRKGLIKVLDIEPYDLGPWIIQWMKKNNAWPTNSICIHGIDDRDYTEVEFNIRQWKLNKALARKRNEFKSRTESKSS